MLAVPERLEAEVVGRPRDLEDPVPGLGGRPARELVEVAVGQQQADLHAIPPFVWRRQVRRPYGSRGGRPDARDQPMTDLVLRGGSVLDGSGGPARTLDIVIRDGRIHELRDRPGDAASGRVIELDGLTLAPGFIDMHSHADFALPSFPGAMNSISQGVTTEVVGNCGYSPAPVADDPGRRRDQISANAGLGPDLAWDWQTFPEFLDRLDEARPSVNVAALVGHGQVRLAVVGSEDRPATPAELDGMRALIGEAVAGGAIGMSSGLVYPPGSYAGTDELVHVAEPLRRRRGIYASHIRSEGDGLAAALREAIDIGRRLETTVEVSHLKAAGQHNHGRAAEALAILDAARASGQRVGNDAYPYTAGSTLLTQLLPPWVQDGGVPRLVERLREPEVRARLHREVLTGLPGWMSYAVASGGWHAIRIAAVTAPRLRHLEGRTIAESAGQAGVDPLDHVFDTLIADDGATVMIVTLMGDADVEQVLAHPATTIGSDQLGVLSPTARVHPRTYGTFARVLGWAVRERGLLTLPDAIHRMTALPAETLGLRDRGRVAPGLVADLVAFDAARVTDTATYEQPTTLATGIELVLLGGVPAVDGGEVVDARLGRVLR